MEMIFYFLAFVRSDLQEHLRLRYVYDLRQVKNSSIQNISSFSSLNIELYIHRIRHTVPIIRSLLRRLQSRLLISPPPLNTYMAPPRLHLLHRPHTRRRLRLRLEN